jgi:hypothetical protein
VQGKINLKEGEGEFDFNGIRLIAVLGNNWAGLGGKEIFLRVLITFSP